MHPTQPNPQNIYYIRTPAFTSGMADKLPSSQSAPPTPTEKAPRTQNSANYCHKYSHEWRNLGILIGFWALFTGINLLATEFNSTTTSTAELLVFRRGHFPIYMQPTIQDTENTPTTGNVPTVIPPQQRGRRRLLDHVCGWVRPGTLTALMGVSGAGKTTLLDVLAKRASIRVVTGDMVVNGSTLQPSFQRQTGYVQQQDLHLATSTPKHVSKAGKYTYVGQVIKMLKMKDYAEAVVGTPGEGLSVEQRKLLTISVELAAKPQLSICAFLRKLADNGQAVLSTIHQPSALLFQLFDRLRFQAKGGKTVYFGQIGEQSRTLLEYFERNGARKCDPSENPAEYMLEIIGAGASGQATKDWPLVEAELRRIRGTESVGEDSTTVGESSDAQGEYALPLISQFWCVSGRVFQQYRRTPEYIAAKFMLGVISGLFIGFSYFLPGQSIQGIQNRLFSSFMLTSIFSTLVQQIMPKFATQPFIVANNLVEIPYQTLLGVLVWASYYSPIYGANQSSDKQGLMLLLVIQFFLFTSTFADLVISSLPDAETARTVATLSFSLILTFNGVMQTPTALPGFWIFMYRVSPLTYLVAGLCGNALHGQQVRCSAAEINIFSPPQGQTCGQYLTDWLSVSPGQVYNPSAMSGCEFCAFTNADQYLALSRIYYSQRWRNFGIGWDYIGFNFVRAAVLYYVFRPVGEYYIGFSEQDLEVSR
ncbi:ABC-2 type transporter-domain-containing protein [Aspergillus pseudodeflectus]|uniref:ABC-2 type transporter-domain-containing protein n=1 Tax=Aspergillus pseudodeflectus TaxID=176178 RepID=A0ABR4JTS4_9EURO